MGTRGTFGFKINGKTHWTYNHYDSYPDGLGNDVVEELARTLQEDRFAEMCMKVAGLRHVEPDSKPTPEDIGRCVEQNVFDNSVGKQSMTDWYSLLRKTQPSEEGFWPMLNVGYMLVHTQTEEFGYLINLDDMTFEVFADNYPESGYAKKGTFPLAQIEAWKDTWIMTAFPEVPEVEDDE